MGGWICDGELKSLNVNGIEDAITAAFAHVLGMPILDRVIGQIRKRTLGSMSFRMNYRPK